MSDAVGAQHIPIGTISNEGPGYRLGLVGAMRHMDIERIEVR